MYVFVPRIDGADVDIPEGELMQGTDHVNQAYAKLITKDLAGQQQDGGDPQASMNTILFQLEPRQPGHDGSYEMPLVYAAAHDASYVRGIPEHMQDDMCMLLTELLHTQALHHTPQASVEEQLQLWQTQRQVNPEFR
jgi:hypothetical protein